MLNILSHARRCTPHVMQMETIKWMQAKTSHAIAGTGNRSPLSNLSAHTKSSKHCNPERKLHRL
eukprot:scaffold308758_cov19-Tisochrysis_lutea.AAC.1